MLNVGNSGYYVITTRYMHIVTKQLPAGTQRSDNVESTSHDVDVTLYKRHVPAGYKLYIILKLQVIIRKRVHVLIYNPSPCGVRCLHVPKTQFYYIQSNEV